MNLHQTNLQVSVVSVKVHEELAQAEGSLLIMVHQSLGERTKIDTHQKSIFSVICLPEIQLLSRTMGERPLPNALQALLSPSLLQLSPTKGCIVIWISALKGEV